MPINKNKYNCSGCTACECVCPVSCIEMILDPLGFKYPKVDLSRCINCNLCENVCPFDSNYNTDENYDIPHVFVGRSREKEELKLSQSGALFAVLSDWILEHDGFVYGVGYKDFFKVTHKKALNKCERDEFRGSKYVQSDLDGVFREIKSLLKGGNEILFSGTPCQVAGLLAYIPPKLKEKLYTIDIICHGVGSPLIWNEFLSFLEKKEGHKLEKVNFRDKRFGGWHTSRETFKFKGLKRLKTYPFRFYSHTNIRYSCFKCPFTNTRRCGDITIGDSWGIENTEYAYLGQDKLGCSLILVNNRKGEMLLEEVKYYLILEKVDISKFLQPQLIGPLNYTPEREKFERDYLKHGFKFVLNKYWLTDLKSRIKYYFPCFMWIKRVFS